MRTLSSGEATRNEILWLRFAQNAAFQLWTRLGHRAKANLAPLAHLALVFPSYALAVFAVSEGRKVLGHSKSSAKRPGYSLFSAWQACSGYNFTVVRCATRTL